MAENKPIRKLKIRIRYGLKNEFCPFCIEFSSVHYHPSAFVCGFLSPTGIKNGDRYQMMPLEVGNELRPTINDPMPLKGSPCLKTDWLNCPLNVWQRLDI